MWYPRSGILGQVWYLIVSFPDLCHLSYFPNKAAGPPRTEGALRGNSPHAGGHISKVY